jgi:hypothetical protein
MDHLPRKVVVTKAAPKRKPLKKDATVTAETPKREWVKKTTGTSSMTVPVAPKANA